MYSQGHKNRIVSFFSMLLLSGVVALAGCAHKAQGTNEPATAAVETKTATILYHLKSSTLDPHNNWGPLRAGVTETLVRLDDQLQLKPWLATKWETRDNRTWVFTIRDGITFHNGLKLDAVAVKQSLERAITVNKSLAVLLNIDWVEASGQELTIITKEPLPSLPSELVNPVTSIVSVEAERSMGTDAFDKAPVGTGPFKVKHFTSNERIVLERYDGYWDGISKLSEVVMKFNDDGYARASALQSHEVDIATQLPSETLEAIASDKDLKVESGPSLRVHYLMFNQQKPLMQDIRVRQAFDLLLNREWMANEVMHGNATPANGPYSMRLPFGSKEPVQKFDPDAAKKLLVEAGFREGADGKLVKDGKPLTLELVTYKLRHELPLIAQLVKSDAAKAGITIQVKTVEYPEIYLFENKHWDMATYSSLTAPLGDGGYFLRSALMPGGSVNPANISIGKLSAVVDRLNTTNDVEQRNQLVKEAASVIKEELPHAYAVYPKQIYGVNKRVTNWTLGPEEHYIITNKLDVK